MNVEPLPKKYRRKKKKTKDDYLFLLKAFIAGFTLFGGAILALVINVVWKNKCLYIPQEIQGGSSTTVADRGAFSHGALVATTKAQCANPPCISTTAATQIKTTNVLKVD
ncbi:uncharacterized protein LOC115878039 [Sitophilus oryzae]|uniref:Uncharacterized protein LOC115878039 n=1 Tax=Sitophilus oryzae TaxID=7048 RepID=A0A6J2XH61_SITOR|nr:uncharacterized protein LOC115878039 [Sitophilus oryzae]